MPTIVAELGNPSGCLALDLEDLGGVEDQVVDGLEAGMAEFAPMADTFPQFVEVSSE